MKAIVAVLFILQIMGLGCAAQTGADPAQSHKNENHRTTGKPPMAQGALNEYLAGKAEKLLSIKGNPIVENVKVELEQQIQYNFLRTISILLIAGPVPVVQESNKELLRLMRDTLNGDLDFKSVVTKIPFLLREDQSTRLRMVLDEIQVNKINDVQNLRQTPTPTNTTNSNPTGIQVEHILDAASRINWKQIGNFLKELPEIFEGIQTIVESVQDIL